jgi:small-conductance mechanosensitive channel
MIDALLAANVRLTKLLMALNEGPMEMRHTWASLCSAMATSDGIVALTYGLILLVIAGGMEWLYWSYATAALRATEIFPVASRIGRLKLAIRRFVLIAFGQTLFSTAALGGIAYFDWPEGAQTAVVTAVLLIAAVRSVWLIADVILAPGRPQWRLLDVDSTTSRVLVGASVGMAMLWATGELVPPLLEKAIAANAAETLRILVATSTLVLVLLATHAVQKVEQHIGNSSQRQPPRFPLSFLVTVVVVSVYGIWLAAGTVPTVLAATFVVTVLLQCRLRAAVYFWVSPASSAAADGLHTHRDLAPSIVLSVARYAVIIIAVSIVMIAMGIPITQVVMSDNPLMRLGVHLFGVAGLVLATHMAWIAIRVPIDRRLHALGSSLGEPDPSARLRTLLPLLRTTCAIVFLVLLALSALWTLGVEMTPLLAGAGVFGVAFGFGAQALVRDVIAGVFYLVEDAFRVGEYIESGSTTKGKVERITLRTIALRHHDGPLHFVPYGSLGTVRNNSRDWVIEKFDLPLPVDIDSEQIRELIKKVGEAMQTDPEIGPVLREPLKAKLHRIDPGVKIFRCKVETTPGNQFDVRAEALRRIEVALKENGIRFASGSQTVLLPASVSPTA